MINAVDLDQYTIIDESSMINDDFENFSRLICRLNFSHETNQTLFEMVTKHVVHESLIENMV